MTTTEKPVLRYHYEIETAVDAEDYHLVTADVVPLEEVFTLPGRKLQPLLDAEKAHPGKVLGHYSLFIGDEVQVWHDAEGWHVRTGLGVLTCPTHDGVIIDHTGLTHAEWRAARGY